MSFFSELFSSSTRRPHHRGDAAYADVIARTAGMVGQRQAKRLARRRGLAVLDLTWEDAARFEGSCVGPNISDMTIQVSNGEQVTCMPVIRYPNFSDRTADVSIDDVFLRVGNEAGGPLRRISLRAYLRDLRQHLSDPSSWKGKQRSVVAPREKEVLVSAQACFLPVPQRGEATFNPVLFNYQSYAGAPAVLAIVASREGASATIIDNQRDGFAAGRAWGQRLFFNDAGQRASFTGTRLEEFVAGGGDALDGPVDVAAAKKAGLNCVLVIQVPLVQPERLIRRAAACAAPLPGAAPMGGAVYRTRGWCQEDSDVDEAVIGHGETEGPFTEIDGLPIERDARYPIRITVQFYKATSNGVVSVQDLDTIAEQIEAIYADAKAVGSLVTEADRGRSTEWDDEGQGKAQPTDWWPQFWARQEAATGKSRQQLMRELEQLLGRQPGESELASAIREVFGSR